MALRLTEGFEWANTPILIAGSAGSGYAKWSAQNVGSSTTTATASGTAARFNGQGMRVTQTGATAPVFTMEYDFAGIAGYVYLGFAFRVSTLPTGNATLAYTLTGGLSAGLVLTSAGAIKFVTGSGALSATTTVADTGYAGPTIAANTWYYVEWKVKAGSGLAAGDFQVHVNGTLANGNSGAITNNFSGSSLTTGLGLGFQITRTWATAATIDYDDLYICDASGSRNNAFLGDCRVETLFPTSDSAVNSAWVPTPSGAGTNWQRVKEAPPDKDTTFVSTSTTGARDGYLLGSLSSAPAAIFGVMTIAVVSDNLGSNSRKVNDYLVSGPTTLDAAQSGLVVGSYLAYTVLFETDPNTSAAWTASAVNSLEAGIKLAV